jgi:hypothetical protein
MSVIASQISIGGDKQRQNENYSEGKKLKTKKQQLSSTVKHTVTVVKKQRNFQCKKKVSCSLMMW